MCPNDCYLCVRSIHCQLAPPSRVSDTFGLYRELGDQGASWRLALGVSRSIQRTDRDQVRLEARAGQPRDDDHAQTGLLLGGSLLPRADQRSRTLDRRRGNVRADARTHSDRRGKTGPAHRPKTAPGPQDWLAESSRERTDGRQISQIEPEPPDAASHDDLRATDRRIRARATRLTKATADLLAHYYDVRTKVIEPLSLDVIPAKAQSHRRHSRTDSHKLRARPGAQTATAKGCRGRARIDDVRPVARRGLEFRFRPSESLGPRRRLVNRPLRQSGKSANERAGLPSHFSRRRPRDGAHAGHPALHRLRVHDERIELIGRSGPRTDWLCPECVQKVWWACHADPIKHYKSLVEFAKEHDLKAEAGFWQKSLDRLSATDTGREPRTSHPPLGGNESAN